jgi:hypothetical protein
MCISSYGRASLLGGLQVPKRKVFVSYHHGNDQAYYNAFSQHFSENYNVITDRSLDRNIDSINTDYVMRKIREDHLTGTSATIVLCGAETPNRKYVDWEIKATLDKKHALIGVILPTARAAQNGNIIVPDRFYDNHHTGYAVWVTWDDLINSGQTLGYYINLAVEHAQSNSHRIDNSFPLMLRNKSSNYSY